MEHHSINLQNEITLLTFFRKAKLCSILIFFPGPTFFKQKIKNKSIMNNRFSEKFKYFYRKNFSTCLKFFFNIFYIRVLKGNLKRN